MLAAVRRSPPGSQRQPLSHRRRAFSPRAATAHRRRPHLRFQPLDGGHRPVHRKRAAHRTRPDHRHEQGRIQV